MHLIALEEPKGALAETGLLAAVELPWERPAASAAVLQTAQIRLPSRSGNLHNSHVECW